MDIESLQNFFCAADHLLEHRFALIGLRESKHLDFIELVHPDQAPFLAAGGPASLRKQGV